MVNLQDLIIFLNKLLKPTEFKDLGPNGLQVEGVQAIHKIVTGVSSCQALFEKAIEEKANAVLVHHGLFWSQEPSPITGIKYNRIAALIKNNISLIGYHLPLDFHPIYGNNIQLANVLKLTVNDVIDFDDNGYLNKFYLSHLDQAIDAEGLSMHIEACLNRKPLLLSGGSKKIETVGWCTGGAQDFIWQAKQFHCDAYITGEVSERTTHLARELGVHCYAAGHHATERYGIKALGEHLAKEFQLDCQFIDIDNPV